MPEGKSLFSPLDGYFESDTFCSKAIMLELLFMSKIHGCSFLIPKMMIEQIGFFDENLKTTQDYALWYALLKNDASFFYINKKLMISRRHENQGTTKYKNIHVQELYKLHLFFVDTFYVYINTLSDAEKRFYYCELIARGYVELASKVKCLDSNIGFFKKLINLFFSMFKYKCSRLNS